MVVGAAGEIISEKWNESFRSHEARTRSDLRSNPRDARRKLNDNGIDEGYAAPGLSLARGLRFMAPRTGVAPQAVDVCRSANGSRRSGTGSDPRAHGREAA